MYTEWSVVFGEQPNTTKWNILGDNDAYFNDSLNDGWVNPDETWTYASATTFTVSGDVTSKYRRGVRLRLKQGGSYKYFVVVTSIYGAPNTTVTVTDAQGGAVYTIANSAITDNWFSLAVMPGGWPLAATVASFQGADGWTYADEDWSFNSADAPSYVVTTSGDLTAKYTPGMRVKLTHSSSVKYFIITKVTYSAPNTVITLYGGTDYTLSASALTNVYYSHHKAPAGFPLDPTKWTVAVNDTSSRNQSNPVSGTWYNLGTTNSQITVPIGAWTIYYEVLLLIAKGITAGTTYVELSTSNSATTDSLLKSGFYAEPNSVTQNFPQCVRKEVVLSSKQLYYLIAMFDAANATALQFVGAARTTKIRAICAYL